MRNTILSPEVLFDRKGFEVNPNDFWKFNTTQLEEQLKKQETFIRKVKALYQEVQLYLIQ